MEMAEECGRPGDGEAVMARTAKEGRHSRRPPCLVPRYTAVIRAHPHRRQELERVEIAGGKVAAP